MASVINNTTPLPRQSSPPHSTSNGGRYESLGGISCYVTGNRSSTKAVIDIHDAFRLLDPAPASLSSADVLASELDALVIIPDLSPRIPKDVPQLGEYLSEMRGSGLSENFEFMSAASAEAQRMWPEVEAWGVFGLSKYGEDDVQMFYNPLAVLLYIQLTVAAMAKESRD